MKLYETEAGSQVRLYGENNCSAIAWFDWFEEPEACSDCEVDPQPDQGFLTWACDVCGGGSAELTLKIGETSENTRNSKTSKAL